MKTRSAWQRKVILQNTGNIKPNPSPYVMGTSPADLRELRKKGRLAMSRIEAVLARRAEFRKGN